MRTITVRLYDSLGSIVTEYTTRIAQDAYDNLVAIAEETDHGLLAVKDCEVDGELGWKEYTL
jgi:hypothetical protein